MGTKMGFPPGVRIQLRDNSAYSVVENPATTAGIVGFASKGELNKIIQVNTTAEQDAKLGYGYQSYKYNQGMYAARAVLDAGGVVEFVRPYGEEIDRTDPRKRDLKTDAFVVAFDKNAGQYKCEADQTSFQIEHFAATRFKTDGAAAYGVTRKINNIAEAVTTGKNVDFGLTASEDYADSNKARKWDGEHCTDMVLFAIMNRDPSYAYRAFDRFEVVGEPGYPTVIQPSDNTISIVVTLSTVPSFTIGDDVLLPASGSKNNNTDAIARVTDIEDKVVTLQVSKDYIASGKQFFNAIIFSNPDSAVEDGFDYMNIKTAVAGQGVKKFAAAKWGYDTDVTPSDIKPGDRFTFKNKNGNDIDIRLWKGIEVTQNGTISEVDGNLEIPCADLEVIEGDTISVKIVDETDVTLYSDLYVKEVKNGNAVVAIPSGYEEPQAGTIKVAITECSEGMFYADVNDADTWEKVASAVVKVLNSSALGYAKSGIVNNINSAKGTTIVVDPSAAFDYSIGDKVAVVRASKSVDNTAKCDYG